MDKLEVVLSRQEISEMSAQEIKDHSALVCRSLRAMTTPPTQTPRPLVLRSLDDVRGLSPQELKDNLPKVNAFIASLSRKPT